MSVLKYKDGQGVWQDLTAIEGNDGYSPVVTIAEITGGHRVSITDATHQQTPQTFDVMDGYTGNYLDCSPYSETSRFAGLSSALSSVPADKRKEHALIFFIDNSFEANLYGFVSNTLTDAVWLVESYWKRITTKADLDTFAASISGLTSNQSKILKVGTYDYLFDGLPIQSVFNGTSSYCTVTPITLSQDGDGFEAIVSPSADLSSGYGLTTWMNGFREAIGATRTSVSVRAEDESWILPPYSFTEKSRYKLKVSFEDGNIVTYLDDVAVHTYTGQKSIKIVEFGKSYYHGFWKGEIEALKINGVPYRYISTIPGYSGTDITSMACYSFLTEEQNTKLQGLAKDVYVVPSASSVKAYVKVKENIYISLTVVHEQDTSDAVYKDEWRLASDTDLYYAYDGARFNALGKTILVGAENEFAISFDGMGDYTGGYHGDERIDLDNDCYIEFIADGKAFSISDLVTKGAFWCDSFAYRQRSTLYASYAYNTGHLSLGRHVKLTEFRDGGFVTRNYASFDLTSLGVSTLTVLAAFTGLLCPHKDVAHIITGDNGDKYTATNPSATVILAEEINQYSRKVDMQNGDCSCRIDSKLLGTNVAEWQDAPVDVDIMDRQNDNKYYSYLPANAAIETGDFFATECSVFWKKH